MLKVGGSRNRKRTCTNEVGPRVLVVVVVRHCERWSVCVPLVYLILTLFFSPLANSHQN